jgi:hypothetical protein
LLAADAGASDDDIATGVHVGGSNYAKQNRGAAMCPAKILSCPCRRRGQNRRPPERDGHGLAFATRCTRSGDARITLPAGDRGLPRRTRISVSDRRT